MPLELQVTQEPRVRSATPDCLDLLDHQDTLDRRDQLVLQDSQVKSERSGIPAHQDLLVQLVPKAQPEQLDTRDLRVHQDNAVLPEVVEIPDQLDLLVSRVALAFRATPEQPDLLE